MTEELDKLKFKSGFLEIRVRELIDELREKRTRMLSLRTNCNKYKQALKEIKELATLSQAHQDLYFLQRTIMDILQKINEVNK